MVFLDGISGINSVIVWVGNVMIPVCIGVGKPMFFWKDIWTNLLEGSDLNYAVEPGRLYGRIGKSRQNDLTVQLVN